MQTYLARPPVAVVLKEGALSVSPGAGRIKAADLTQLLSAQDALAPAQARRFARWS